MAAITKARTDAGVDLANMDTYFKDHPVVASGEETIEIHDKDHCPECGEFNLVYDKGYSAARCLSKECSYFQKMTEKKYHQLFSNYRQL